MALAKQVGDILNTQINKELYSAYLYMTFADYYEGRGLKGFANWYMIQAGEEVSHAKILRRYLLDNDYAVKMYAIAEPDKTFTDDMGPLQAALEHERYVTSLINDCYAAAYEIRDFRTMQMLDWFIKEQGEEEANASEMVSNMELFGSDPKGLYALDREYLARTFTPTASMPM
jgi:ferritin